MAPRLCGGINHLSEATGLSRSSLYQRFGDKDGLFREALAAYTRRVLSRMNVVEADTARGRLEGMLRAYLHATPDRKRPAGCLISRSSSRSSPAYFSPSYCLIAAVLARCTAKPAAISP
uniref:TetR/AcrR family transcriptional regulator n=1 Tax=Paraburkholderia youngii TaxID=2782701 RepID=UPI0035D4D29B